MAENKRTCCKNSRCCGKIKWFAVVAAILVGVFFGLKNSETSTKPAGDAQAVAQEPIASAVEPGSDPGADNATEKELAETQRISLEVTQK